MVGLIPSRYPGSESSGDYLVKLARKPYWIATSTDAAAGLGQRMLATNDADYALFDVRRIVWDGTDE